MASSGDDDSGVSSKDTKSTTKAKRGKICLHKVAKRRAVGEVLDVTFNRLGQPFGKVASEMQSYIGLLVREHVKVSYKTWRDVPKNVKNLIWETVKSSYKVPEKWYKGCLESAASKFRTWRSRLYKEHIEPNKNDDEKLAEPPSDSGIQPADWIEFVKSRISKEAEALSEVQSQRRGKHVYPHRLSRKGYANFAEEIKRKKELLRDEDIPEEDISDEDINRALLWKKARLNKKGEIDDENLKSTIEKIDDYIHLKGEGNLQSAGDCTDVLSRALDKPEHSGRVRGIGAGVNPSLFFKTVRVKQPHVDASTQQELEEYKKKVDEYDGRIHVLDKVIYELMNQIGKLEANNVDNKKLSEGIGSCSVVKPSNKEKPDQDVVLIDESTRLQGKTVELLLGSTKKIVAYGTIVVASDVLHGAPMPANCFRVSVDEVMDEHAVLPFRVSDEIQNVGSVLGTHVAWPTNLVVEKLKKTNVKKGVKKVITEHAVRNLALLPASLAALYFVMEKSFKDGKGIHVRMDVELFGIDVGCWILQDCDLIPFCNLEPISGNCILAYMWHLYRKLKGEDMNGRFLFVNPFTVSYTKGCPRDDRARLLSERLLDTASNQHVIVPCNVGEHWILTVIEADKNCVYLLDPLCHRNRDTAWKYIVDTAMSIANAKKGKNWKKGPKWEIVKGPIQPDSKQCGYYVMRFMKEIVEGLKSDNSISITSLFPSALPYSTDEINEIREEWGSCVISHILD